MRVLNIYRETISDGPGLRYAIYLSGCRHACPGCHNPRSWDPDIGMPMTSEMQSKIISEILCDGMLDGITVSGGDPFFCPDELALFLAALKDATSMNIWCYTGYTIEVIMADRNLRAPLPYIDVLVDGRFIQSLSSPNLMWRGSSNQRIIRLRNGHPVRESEEAEGLFPLL